MRIAAAIGLCAAVVCNGQPAEVPLPKYHLTARPIEVEPLPRKALLDAVDSLATYAAQHQNAEGAYIDPVLGHEHQYATPYLAFAIATLVDAGRTQLLDSGLHAMDYATACVAAGRESIPDDHGEFFLAPLTGAIALFEDEVPEERIEVWRGRMETPLEAIIEGAHAKTNNWRTYAMRGEWLRAQAGLVDRERAAAFIEDAWVRRTQRERIVLDRWSMYQDWNGHPQSHAVEAVGRVNLLAMVFEHEEGLPYREEIAAAVERGTRASLLFQDPTGQCPPNGRTDDHVFNDVLYGLCFDMMAVRSHARGDEGAAGQFRRAADLAYGSIERWRRDDGGYSITKNHFPHEERVGFQPASQVSNYSGALMVHIAEAYHVRGQDLSPAPAPTEIGGYAIEADPRFGSYVANAGGMLVQVNLLGDSVAKYGEYWTPIGGVRYARGGWDSRLGPSDGVRDAKARSGLTFAPAWKKGRRWVRLADMAEHYRGTVHTELVHPLLVKFSVLYSPVTGVGGPSFRHDFVVTPDGVFTSLTSPHLDDFALTIPLLENDGRALETVVGTMSASTRYPSEIGDGSEQHFLRADGGEFVMEDEALRSTYGWLRPVRAEASGGRVDVFVYPRGSGDREAAGVQESLESYVGGFRSTLSRVEGSLYVGEHAAGGFGRGIDIDGDGEGDIIWDRACGFIAQLRGGRVIAIECDRDISGTVMGTEIEARAYTPIELARP